MLYLRAFSFSRFSRGRSPEKIKRRESVFSRGIAKFKSCEQKIVYSKFDFIYDLSLWNRPFFVFVITHIFSDPTRNKIEKAIVTSF